jgi:hypothetical protein
MISVAETTQNLQEIRLTNDLVFNSFEPIPFNFKKEERFLYGLSKMRGLETIFFEEGIGTQDGNIVRREFVLGVGPSRQFLGAPPSSLSDFSCDEGEFLIIETVLPINFLEAYIDPYTVLVSNEDYLEAVKLDQNTVLGRIGDKIQGVSLSNIEGQTGPKGDDGIPGMAGPSGATGFTGPPGVGKFTSSEFPPENPEDGERWFNTANGKFYTFVVYDNKFYWIQGGSL